MRDEAYDLGLAHWKVALQYLSLVEAASIQIARQKNSFGVVKDVSKGPVTDTELERKTRWSDHRMIIPLLFNLYHGIELLVKGYRAATSCELKPTHGIVQLCEEFIAAHPNEQVIALFLRKFTVEECLPEMLRAFLKANSLSIEQLYQAVRYPTDTKFVRIWNYLDLQYNGDDGVAFFCDLSKNIRKMRRAAVRHGRSLEVDSKRGDQAKSH